MTKSFISGWPFTWNQVLTNQPDAKRNSPARDSNNTKIAQTPLCQSYDIRTLIFQRLRFPGKPSTSTISKTHCSNRIFFRKFETKDMEHKGPFWIITQIPWHPLCAPATPSFFPEPFPLITGYRQRSMWVSTDGHQSSDENHSPPFLPSQTHQNRKHFYSTPKWNQPKTSQLKSAWCRLYPKLHLPIQYCEIIFKCKSMVYCI